MPEPILIKEFHFLAGCISLVGLVIAFAAQKGSKLHIMGGKSFVVTMLILTSSGLWMSISREVLFTVFLSLTSFHALLTGWSAAAKNGIARAVTKYSAGSSALITGGGIWGGQYTANTPNGLLNGLPAGAFYFIAGIAALLMLFDLIYANTRSPSKVMRITRHLWRMGFSSFLATSIFFFGNNHVLPEALRTPLVLSAPVIGVIVLTAFYTMRVLFFSFSTPYKHETD
ncbi:hypothetical protein [Hyphococcus lacteus]|uniref:DUF2306 domain-containing protein n=1 Tax=Hyphococcus lacteus TaxID=3143536 RepID=A0ABV3Z7J5_9PROT